MSGPINVAGLDSARLLATLFNAASPQGLGFLQYTEKPMSIEEAEGHLAAQRQFSYLEGRVLGIDLATSQLKPYHYDHYYGAGSTEQIVALVRRGEDVNSRQIVDLHTARRRAAAEETREGLGAPSPGTGEQNVLGHDFLVVSTEYGGRGQELLAKIASYL